MSIDVVVTGGTGKTGRRVVRQLESAGVSVRPVSRSSEHPFDWEDPRTWAPAVEGARAVYVAPAEGTMSVPAFVALARRIGVEQLVLLSARGITTPGYYDDQEQVTRGLLLNEVAVRESGLRYTILRPGWFAQNFDEGAFRPDVDAGELALPTADGSAAFIDAEDIAAVAVAALTEPERLHGAELELTGPSAVRIADAVRMIAETTGRSIAYRPVTAAEYRASIVAQGVSDRDADLATAALSPIRDGREGEVTSTVPDVLGRPAGTFDAFVARAFG